MPKEITPIAHRGASSYAPENTFAAFDLAVEMGIGEIEFDVHFTQDSQIIVIHDETLDRTTNSTGSVCDRTLEELQSLDAGKPQCNPRPTSTNSVRSNPLASIPDHPNPAL